MDPNFQFVDFSIESGVRVDVPAEGFVALGYLFDWDFLRFECVDLSDQIEAVVQVDVVYGSFAHGQPLVEV
ncbi:hypothetical protein D3C74_483360 [compost metagenome]